MKVLPTSDLRTRTRKVAFLHFLLALVLAVQVIAYDAGKLITPAMTMKRWIGIGALLTITALAWYIAKNRSGEPATLKKLLLVLITTDLALASFYVYIQRGMASRSVILFVLPILVSAALARRSAVIATAIVSIAAYVSTAVSYFVLNFNEGYKLELYGEIGFYSALLLLISLFVWVFVRPASRS